MIKNAILIKALYIVRFCCRRGSAEESKALFAKRNSFGAATAEGKLGGRESLSFFRCLLTWANTMAHKDGAKDTSAICGGAMTRKTGTFSGATHVAKRGITHSPARIASNAHGIHSAVATNHTILRRVRYGAVGA